MKNLGESVVVLDDAEHSRDSFLEMRSRVIGGSDIAAICGLSKWRSPLEVWAEKTGKIPVREDNDALWLGRHLEPVVAAFVQRKQPDWGIQRCGRVFSRTEARWAVATPDYLVSTPESSGAGVLEVKTTGSWAKGDWEEGIPDAAHCQVQWQMGLGNFSEATLAALIGGRDLVLKQVIFDPEVFENLFDIASAFWRMVQEDTPPESAGDVDTSLLTRLYGVDPAKTAALPDEAASLIVQWESAKAEKDKLAKAAQRYEEEIQSAKVRLQAMMKGAGVGVYGNRVVSVKEVVRAPYMVKESRYVSMRIKEVGR